MLKFTPLYTRYINQRLSKLSLLRAGSYDLHHAQLAKGFRAFPSGVLYNREDDLPMGVDSIIDPIELQKATSLWTRQQLCNNINELLHCTPLDSERIYKVNRKILKIVPPKMITNNIQLLLERGISEKSILNHPKILSINNGTF